MFDQDPTLVDRRQVDTEGLHLQIQEDMENPKYNPPDRTVDLLKHQTVDTVEHLPVVDIQHLKGHHCLQALVTEVLLLVVVATVVNLE